MRFTFTKLKQIALIIGLSGLAAVTEAKNIIEYPTSFPLFVGQTNKGSLHKLVKINNYSEFIQQFGTHQPQLNLDKQVELFFLNGGRNIYVYRTNSFLGSHGSLSLGYANSVLNILTSPQISTQYDIITFTDLFDLNLNNYTLFLNQYLQKLDEAHLITVIDATKEISRPNDLKDFITTNHFIYSNLTILFSQNIKYGSVGAALGALIKNDINYNIKKSLPKQKVTLNGLQPKKIFSALEIANLSNVKISAVIFDGTQFIVNHLWTTNDAPEFLHLSVSRVSYMIYKNIKFHLTQYKDFSNNSTTWNHVASDVNAYFQKLFQNKILDGNTSKEAYFTRLDETTTTPQDVVNKKMNLLYGLNLLNHDYLIFKNTQNMTY